MKPEDLEYLRYAAWSIDDVLGFLTLDLDVVWDVIKVHLPLLQPQVTRMLADLDRPHS